MVMTHKPHVYTERCVEYGMSAWCTLSKKSLNRVQNQADRIISGGLTSTPITEMENVSGLNYFDERRETKVLKQAAKFKRLETHPMRSRMLIQYNVDSKEEIFCTAANNS